MTADGSMVYFSTADQLAGDGDGSVDVFRSDVGPGSAAVSRVSTGAGGTGDTDSCSPPGFPEDWNAITGDGKCNVVAFAGGAGVAADDGSFYFVSPEKLDGSNGVADQANLYVSRPGSGVEFVETIDSALPKPGPGPDLHPLEDADFTGENHSTPEAVAVDQSNGDVYVYETGNGKLARYTSAGAAKNFTAVQPYIEGNRITGLPAVGSSQSQVAVDNTPGSPFANHIYVTNDPTGVAVYAQSGEKVGSITGAENIAGSFGTVCGVAVDPNNGALYIGDREFEVIWQYTPKAGATTPITDSDYTVKALVTAGHSGCNVAADSAGHVYSSRFANGPIRSFEEEAFAFPVGNSLGTQFNANSRAVTVDPTTNEVYVQEGGAVKIFNSALELVTTFGEGDLSGSRGIAVNTSTGHAYAPGALDVLEFGREPAPFHPIDNPAVINGVKDADTHRSSDFQVSRNGDFAVFASDLSVTGYPNLGHSQIYRHDGAAGAVECASCATTGAASTSDTTLAPHGLNLTEDGRVFFTSEEGLVLSDTNGVKDPYQWSGGVAIGILSTGRDLNASSLLSVSRDGKNAFFFTRDTLVPTDENAGAVKLYTARVNGGYQQSVQRVPCSAADECRGAGTEQPGPPNINSITGPGKTGGKKSSCAALQRRAKKAGALAKRLRGKARRLAGSDQASAADRKAAKAAKRAKSLRQKAQACRQSSGGNG